MPTDASGRISNRSRRRNHLDRRRADRGALFLWKFKALAAFALTKGKLLLAGLTNSTTLLTMLPSIGLYWTVYGWRFAVGIVISIYVHEMGHVAALRRFGIAASAPMFIPGLGAVIRSRQQPTSARELARVGLGGPIWGLGAAIAAFIMYGLTGAPIWAAIGQFGAWVNLFNLMPVWQLDGAHAFTAMDRRARWLATAAAAVMFFVTREGLLILVAIFAGLQAVHAARADAATHDPEQRAMARSRSSTIASSPRSSSASSSSCRRWRSSSLQTLTSKLRPFARMDRRSVRDAS